MILNRKDTLSDGLANPVRQKGVGRNPAFFTGRLIPLGKAGFLLGQSFPPLVPKLRFGNAFAKEEILSC